MSSESSTCDPTDVPSEQAAPQRLLLPSSSGWFVWEPESDCDPSPGGQRPANRVQINRLLRDWLLGIPLRQRIHGMGTKIGSKYGKTPGKVKKYVPFVGAAFGRPHNGWVILYLSWCFSIFGSYSGTHSVNSLSQGCTQEVVPEQPVYWHPVCQFPKYYCSL